MPEQPLQQFNLEVLEADMKRLSQEIQRRREMPENHILGGQELVKKSIQAMVPAPTPPAPPAQQSGGTLPDYAAEAPAESRLEIEYLVDMALHHGIDKANAQAMKSSPFIIDAFHDAMAAKLYPELQKRGILK
ncbi:MAG TPA: hypothetical protein VMV71_01785 [Candidatus Paceibacterota bacterium]|nr:hypothetical protein [Candidatus Paceibacterota bacterium]